MFAVEQVVALYPYKALREDELNFQKGMVINVLDKQDQAWWKGEVNGQTGMFPSNYVAPLSKFTSENASLQPSVPTSCKFLVIIQFRPARSF